MADIFDEVSEDMRQHQLKRLWSKYGAGFIAALVLLVVVVAGNQFWEYRTDERAKADSEAFGKAVALIDGGQQDEALKALATLQEEGSAGYSFLAGLREADILVIRGDTAGAAKTYERLSANSDYDQVLRQFAELQVIALNIDNPEAGDLKNRLEVLAAPGAAWGPMAEELLALIEINSGDLKGARERLERLAANEDAGQSLQARARELANTIPADVPVAATKPSEIKPQ